MTTAWVIMSAMPPTKGHANLIRFAASLGVKRLNVIVHAKSDEPFAAERFLAVTDFAKTVHTRWQITSEINVLWLNEPSEENPDAPGFWEYWDKTIRGYGFQKGDIWVTSEPYGAILAERLDGVFMPYDPSRELLYTKATDVRDDPLSYFDWIMPEFQHHLLTKVTVFGAESTGKTTLSKALAKHLDGHWFYEWARPYLKTVGPDIHVESMTAIWNGQRATQRHAYDFFDKPFHVFDTDLFSTIGYWEQPHWAKELGEVPSGLIKDAQRYESDLYIITKSNIPFEPEDIRYGGDRRESPDEYWIGVAEKYGLNYVVLDETDLSDRLTVAGMTARMVAQDKTSELYYDRQGY